MAALVLEFILEILQDPDLVGQGVKPLECLTVVRKAALEEDEATEYNGYAGRLNYC